jgi:hypothetical protein
MQAMPEQLTPFFEFDHRGDIRGYLTALAGTGGNAKIRCGGVTPDAIPSSEQVARFIAGCAAADVPFKFTAGLHHPIRAEQPLTYDDDPSRAVMHGFVNVFLAAALAHNKRGDADDLIRCIDETSPHAFTFVGDAANVAGHSLTAEQLERTRYTFAVSVGSCSFTEPSQELRELNIIA